MTSYIDPENQRLLWNVITTSPLFQHVSSSFAPEWFRGIIEEFYITSSEQEISRQTLMDMNMNTVVYMIRDLRRRGEMNTTTFTDTTTVDHTSIEKHLPSCTFGGLTPELRSSAIELGSQRTQSDRCTPDVTTPDIKLGVHRESIDLPRYSPEYSSMISNSFHSGTILPRETSTNRHLSFLKEYSYPSYHSSSTFDSGPSSHNPPYVQTPVTIPYHMENSTIMEQTDRINIPTCSRIPSSSSSSTSSSPCTPWKTKNQEEYRRTDSEHTTEYRPGTLNPLHIPTILKTINIDTRFRESLYTTTSTNFYINLPTTLRKVVSLQLTSYEIPNSFYGISASYGNNFLNLKCTYQYQGFSETTSKTTIIIPDGNMSVSDLIDYINGQLRPLKDDGSLANIDTTSSTSIFNCVQFLFDVTASGSGSGKVTLVAEDAPGFDSSVISSLEMDFTLNIQGEVDTTPLTSKLGWNLGFIHPTYTGATSYVSDTLPETSSMRYIYLSVNDFQHNVNNAYIGVFDNLMNYSMFNSSQCAIEKGNVSNILAKIPINGPQFNILFENSLTQHSPARKYYGPVDIQRMQIQLLDDHGRILNINNVNYSFGLTITTLNE